MVTQMRHRLRRNALRLKRQEAHAHRWERRPWFVVGLGPEYRCRCGATATACDKCRAPMNRTPHLDKPFSKEEFDGEGIWQAYRCKNGHTELDPLD